MNKKPITTSIFDLYKIGPGSSSSHTIGPMVAAGHFRKCIASLPKEKLDSVTHIEIQLYGSLSATGKGHGADRAVAAGLLGWEPHSCDAGAFASLLADPNHIYTIECLSKPIPFNARSIVWGPVKNDFPFRNTMIMKLLSGNKVVLEKEYYSVGGGFIEIKDEPLPPRPEPKYPYSSMKELKEQLIKHHLTLTELLLENEYALTGKTPEEVDHQLDYILDVMDRCVKRGLVTEGVLPGPIGLHRKAPALMKTFDKIHLDLPDRFLIYLDACALAASEENAAGQLVVTAPTSGASGVIPGLLHVIRYYFHLDKSLLKEGLLAAAAIGFIVKHNASISGAEVGCQGEIGTATAMGAALVAYIDTHDMDVVENAAEIALEHQLGLTCDPIGGYVQIPCIERNAVGAVEAYNAYVLASAGDPKMQKISFDQVVRVMRITGKDMASKYKETSEGGLAVSEVFC